MKHLSSLIGHVGVKFNLIYQYVLVDHMPSVTLHDVEPID